MALDIKSLEDVIAYLEELKTKIEVYDENIDDKASILSQKVDKLKEQVEAVKDIAVDEKSTASELIEAMENVTASMNNIKDELQRQNDTLDSTLSQFNNDMHSVIQNLELAFMTMVNTFTDYAKNAIKAKDKEITATMERIKELDNYASKKLQEVNKKFDDTFTLFEQTKEEEIAKTIEQIKKGAKIGVYQALFASAFVGLIIGFVVWGFLLGKVSIENKKIVNYGLDKYKDTCILDNNKKVPCIVFPQNKIIHHNNRYYYIVK